MQGIWAQGPKHFRFNNTSNSTKQFKIRCYPLLPPTKIHQRIISTTYYCATTSLTLSHKRTGVIPQKKIEAQLLSHDSSVQDTGNPYQKTSRLNLFWVPQTMETANCVMMMWVSKLCILFTIWKIRRRK